MNTMIFNFFFFLTASFLAFYIPGTVLLRKLKLPFTHKIIIGIVLGMVLWGWQGFIFGYIGLRGLSYIYLLLFFLIWIRGKPKYNLLNEIKKISIDPTLFVIILLGCLIQLSIVLPTGIFTQKGLSFCCGAVGDNIYHLGITNQIINNIPPIEPGMSGVAIRNYHYWASLVIAEMVRVFHVPLIAVQFQYLPIFVSLFLGLFALIIADMLKLPKMFRVFILVLLYFGGDYIYLVIAALGHGLNFSMGPLENGAAFLNNFPRAYAVIVLLAGLSLFLSWIRTKRLYEGILMAILWGTAIGFKVYIGIFASSGLLFLGLFYFFKKQYKMLVPIIATFIFSLIVYLPVNSQSGGLFFTGFWRFEEFIVQPALGLSRLELARRIYFDHQSFLRVLQYELIFMSIFIFTIFGPKLLGMIQNKKTLAFFPKELNIFLISAIIVNTLAGFFFQQESGGSNSFNFLVSVYIIGSFYAASVCYYFTRKKNILSIIIVVLVLLGTIPRTVYQLSINIKMMKDTYTITNLQLQALDFLKNNTEKQAIVLPLTSGYQVFLANRQPFLQDFGILESHTIDTSDRRAAIKKILSSKSAVEVYKELKKYNIRYLYMGESQQLKSESKVQFLRPVFSNSDIKILRVD